MYSLNEKIKGLFNRLSYRTQIFEGKIWLLDWGIFERKQFLLCASPPTFLNGF